ncbi:hypothetical protein VULLAG_LOCUS14570 [Vulpes lagopus]
MGFEPTRAKHNGLAVHRLNHSATSSHVERPFLHALISHLLRTFRASPHPCFSVGFTEPGGGRDGRKRKGFFVCSIPPAAAANTHHPSPSCTQSSAAASLS